MRDCVVIGGKSHPELLTRICRDLDVEPGPVEVTYFANGETNVNIVESVREKTVYVVQSACGEVNDAFMELVIMISACKAASAKQVVAVLPMFPYSRQINLRDALRHSNNENDQTTPTLQTDFHSQSHQPSLRQPPPPQSAKLSQHQQSQQQQQQHANMTPTRPTSSMRTPNASTRPSISRQVSMINVNSKEDPVQPQYNPGFKYWLANPGELIASLLNTSGADRIITMDLHDAQYQGFFDIPVDNLYGRRLLEQYIATMVPNWRETVIVSPDAGGAKRATSIADHLGLEFALIHQDSRNNATLLVGDVEGRVAILLDDMIDSGKTMSRASKVMRENGATSVIAICTHGVFSGDALARLRKSPIDRLVTTNSVPQRDNQKEMGDWMQVVDVSHVFAEAVRRIYNGESISMLFEHAIGVIQHE